MQNYAACKELNGIYMDSADISELIVGPTYMLSSEPIYNVNVVYCWL